MTHKLAGVLQWAVPGLLAAVVGSHAIPSRAVRADVPAAHTRSRLVYQHALPQLDATHLKVSIVEVRYAPGESSPPHSHPCPVIGHVVEGAFRIQVKGEPEAVYKVGESFYEAPNGVHQISRNASDTEPARLIAYFVCDHETPLSVPVTPKRRQLGREAKMNIDAMQATGRGLPSMRLTPDMKRVITEQRLAFVATVCPDGTPNLSPKGTIAVFDDEHLVFADIRSPATIRNLEKNPSTEINIVDQFCRRGYRFKGTAQIVREGDLYRDIQKFYAQRWVDVGKGSRELIIRCFVLIKVEEALPLISPAYDGGAEEEQIRHKWIEYFDSLNTKTSEQVTESGNQGQVEISIDPCVVFEELGGTRKL